MANSYRQDVISNNIANSETVGFKRDLVSIRERATATQELGLSGAQGDDVLQNMAGGMFGLPSMLDSTQGIVQPTGNPLDVAIQGNGFFAVNSGGKVQLTRNGQFLMNRYGDLVMANDTGQSVLDSKQNPIHLDPTQSVSIGSDGVISQGNKPVGQLGVFNIPDPSKLKPSGGTLIALPGNQDPIPVDAPQVHSGAVELSNVDPTTELAELMDTQRQLEANANMIRTQDETLDKLVNDVGRVS